MLAVREQPSFAGGMFQSVAPERIPENGAWDIENGLLEEDGSCNRRGGSSYYTSALGTLDLTWIWSGYIGSSKVVLTADPADYGNVSGGAIANLGGAGRDTPAGRAAVMGGVLYLPGGVETITSVPAIGAAPAKVAPFYASVANRLLAGNGRRIDFSGIGTPGTFGATDYHELPDGASLLGLEGLRDSAVCFTTRGIYIISGLALQLTSAAGDVQQRIDRYSRDGRLWGDAGIAGWEGGLVAPMRDGVWLIGLGVASEAVQAYRLMSKPVADIYRSYVDAGYRPGGAEVFRGHYILPILKPSGNLYTWADTLICRLDLPGTPWTRATGVRVMAVTATPDGELLAAGPAGQVVKLGWFDDTTATDAGGAGVSFRLRTRDMAAGRRNTSIVKLRAEYEMDDGQTATPLASDDFSSTVGGLDLEAADLGGAWATSGAATDFTASAGGVIRAATTGTRLALLGAGVAVATGQARLKTAGSPELAGVVGRYVNATNYAYAGVIASLGVLYLRAYKVVAGVTTLLGQVALGTGPITDLAAGTAFVRLAADAAGAWTASIVTSSGVVRAQTHGTDPVLATAGALATGQWGLINIGDGLTTGTVLYDDFTLMTLVTVTSALDAYLVEGPTTEGYQVQTLLGSAPANLTVGAEPGTFTYTVQQSSRYGRFEFRCDDPASRVSLRRLELFVRENGRQ